MRVRTGAKCAGIARGACEEHGDEAHHAGPLRRLHLRFPRDHVGARPASSPSALDPDGGPPRQQAGGDAGPHRDGDRQRPSPSRRPQASATPPVTPSRASTMLSTSC